MKITSSEYLEQLQHKSPLRSQKAASPEDQGFSRLMAGSSPAASAGSGPESGSSAANLLENDLCLGRIMASRKIGESLPPAERQLEEALDQIEQYANALGDSRKTLRDIAPLAEDLHRTAGQLSELSRNLPEGNPLKGLSGEAAVLATVEAMKFRRGDFV